MRRLPAVLAFLGVICVLACLAPHAASAAPGGITRDDWGVPRITAPDIPKLMYALGWATAEDRLIQLDLTRRKAAGRIAEFAGKDLLQDDIAMRKLGLAQIARRDLERLRTTGPEAYDALVEYSRGINDYIAENGLPDEYFILPRFEEWKPEDTLLAAALMHLYLSGDSDEEFARLNARARGGDFTRNQALTDAAVAARGWFPSIHEPMAMLASASPFGGSFAAQCSNAFAVSGKLTADGKAVVCGDPHLDVTFPGIMYEVALEVPGKLDIRGITIPGTCLVTMGDNGYYAWCITALQADNEDVMIVPKSCAAEVLGEAPKERQETVAYRDGFRSREEKVTVLDTPFGPVVREDDANYYVLHSTALYENDQALGFLNLDMGRSLADFRAALAQMLTPYNFAYADAKGNIAYFAAGMVPIRSYNPNDAQVVDTPEKAAQYRWSFIAPEDMPSIVNPERGYIVTSNDPPALTAEGLPVFPGNYAAGFRNHRISNLIEGGTKGGAKLTREGLAHIQCDVHSLFAEEMLPPLLPRLQAMSAQMTGQEQEALSILAAWDYEEFVSSQGAPLYELMRIMLFRKLWSDHAITADTDIVLLAALNGAGWVTLGDDEILACWKGAVADAVKETGKLPAYSEIHKMPLVCPLPFYLTQQPGLVPADGGFSTVNVSAVRWEGKYLLKNFAATARLIMSPGVEDGYWSVIPGGNSGCPGSPNFADQVSLYLAGNYKYQPAR